MCCLELKLVNWAWQYSWRVWIQYTQTNAKHLLASDSLQTVSNTSLLIDCRNCIQCPSLFSSALGYCLKRFEWYCLGRFLVGFALGWRSLLQRIRISWGGRAWGMWWYLTNTVKSMKSNFYIAWKWAKSLASWNRERTPSWHRAIYSTDENSARKPEYYRRFRRCFESWDSFPKELRSELAQKTARSCSWLIGRILRFLTSWLNGM